MLLSDDADLYYKGIGTRIERRPGRGTATPSGTTDEITLLSSANDFATDIVTVKQALSVQARAMRKEADGLRQIVRRLEARKARARTRVWPLAPASTSVQSELANLTGEIEILSQKVKELEQQAAELQARFDGTCRRRDRWMTRLPSLLVARQWRACQDHAARQRQGDRHRSAPAQSTADAGPGTWQIVT